MATGTEADGKSADTQPESGAGSGGVPSRRLLIVEEHALMAAGLRLALSERGWVVETNGELTTLAAVDHARRFEPHCVLLGTTVRHGGADARDLIAPLASTGTKVVILTSERRRAVLGAYLESGAAGWVGIDTDVGDVDAALTQVVAGQSIVGRTRRADLLEQLRLERERALRARATFDRLTQREALVLASLSEGLSAEDIAEEHFVALTTVRSQIRGVLQKLGVNSQLAAVAVADAHRDLLPVEPKAGRDRRRVDPRDRAAGSAQPARTA